MSAAKAIATGCMVTLAFCLGTPAAPAAAKQVYDYSYSGQYVDGSGSEGGPFAAAPLDLGLDAANGQLLALRGGKPGYLTRLTQAGAGVPFGAAGLGDTIAFPQGLGQQSQIAVDNSGGPDDGNFYVAAAGFGGLSGIFGFKRDGTPIPAFGAIDANRLCGVAVDPQGFVWVARGNGFDGHAELHRYAANGTATGLVVSPPGFASALCDPAIDGPGNFYATVSGSSVKLDPAGAELYEVRQAADGGFAIDPADESVFVAGAARVVHYDSLGAWLDEFGDVDAAHSFAGLQGVGGIALDPGTGDLWVANGRSYEGTRHLERFQRGAPITVPTVITGAVDHALTSATLRGTVDPDGVETIECRFEWGTTQALGNVIPCSEGPFAGSGSNPASAEISELKKGTTYYYRLVALNANERPSAGTTKKFIAQDKPILDDVFASQVNTDGVRLNGEVDPNGGNTTFRFEWGTDESYGHFTTQSSTFGPIQGKAIDSIITGLAPGTTYHYRLLATNEAGTSTGSDHRFTTYRPDSGLDPCPNSQVRQQTGAALLLDCRAYELASAANTGGYDVESDLLGGQVPLSSSPRASDRLLYSVRSGLIPGLAGNPTNFERDPYLARRGSGGWSTEYVGLPAGGMSDTGAFGSPLLESDSKLDRFAFGGSGICNPCFEDGSVNIPLRRPGGAIAKGMVGSLSAPANPAGAIFKRFSADGSHLVFGTATKLEPTGKSGQLTIYDRDLDSGVTQVVSTLPNGTTMTGGNAAALDISADGSRILIGQKIATDAKGNDYYHPYMHVGEEPRAIDLAPAANTAGVLIAGMTADGSRVFFTTADRVIPAQDTDQSVDVYEANVDPTGKRTLSLVSVGQAGPSNDDSCEPPGVPDAWNAAAGNGRCNALAFAGGAGTASASGSFYFLSPELLDGPANGEAGEANLYLVEPGAKPRFVAVMDSSAGKPGPQVGLGLLKTFGSFAGQVFFAVDNSGGPSDGDLYVCESGSRLVKKFDSDGNPITSWGVNGVLDGSSAAEGPFDVEIFGIAVGPGGNLNVMSYDYNASDRLVKVFKFAEDGSPVATLKWVGVQAKQLGIATDSSGTNFYAIDNYFSKYGQINRYAPIPWPDDRQKVELLSFATEAGPPPITAIAADTVTDDVFASRVDGSIDRYSVDGQGKVVQPAGEPCQPPTFGGGGGCEKTDVFRTDLPGVKGLAVNPLDHHVFASLGDSIVELDVNGEQVGNALGSGLLSNSSVIAYGQSANRIYASGAGGGKAAIFGSVPTSWRPLDNPAIVNAIKDPGKAHYGDFQITPDGRFAAFSSGEQLVEGVANRGHSGIYRYAAQGNGGSGQLVCASCAPTGAAAGSDTYLAPHGLSLTDDGRVFFTSEESFVLRDTNRQSDVYEWSGGDIQLISTGASPTDSSLLTASADGTDVFFFTRQKLSGEDENGSAIKIYDARAGGGFLREPQQLPCAASDECHGAGTQAPPPPSINTVTGSGRPTRIAKGPKKCKKRTVRRRGRCVKRHRKVRRHSIRHRRA